MTKLRVVHRPWLARPYVVEAAPWIGTYVSGHGEEQQFGYFEQRAAYTTKAEALGYLEHVKSETVVAEIVI